MSRGKESEGRPQGGRPAAWRGGRVFLEAESDPPPPPCPGEGGHPDPDQKEPRGRGEGSRGAHPSFSLFVGGTESPGGRAVSSSWSCAAASAFIADSFRSAPGGRKEELPVNHNPPGRFEHRLHHHGHNPGCAQLYGDPNRELGCPFHPVCDTTRGTRGWAAARGNLRGYRADGKTEQRNDGVKRRKYS